jgi:hypothetical protein
MHNESSLLVKQPKYNLTSISKEYNYSGNVYSQRVLAIGHSDRILTYIHTVLMVMCRCMLAVDLHLLVPMLVSTTRCTANSIDDAACYC